MPIDFQYKYDKKTKATYIETALKGKPLLTTPQLNKGSAFTTEERHTFGLLGKLPPHIDTLEQQTTRAYVQFKAYISDLQRHIYLNNLHDTNQVLFYKLVGDHLEDMLPLIYTPHVGTAVKTFSQQFRQPRGLYISYDDMEHIDEILENRTNPEVDLVVVTDGEAVLGIGDQGVGAINIPIAKLMVYTLCGGINPTRTLPIMLDVGTNNQSLLNDPMYLGRRHERLTGAPYEKFIKTFISAIKKHFPKVFLHWEDFSARTSHHNLALCKDKVCSFNDDVQGTGCVALATILAALKTINSDLPSQRILIFGAGSAGIGIANQIYSALIKIGLSEQEARDRFWLIDKDGLLTTNSALLSEHQKRYARNPQEISNWIKSPLGGIGLNETIENIKPSILIGCSSMSGAFTEEIVRLMASYNPHPIIMPLSNPTQNSEAKPEDIIHWTKGSALIAVGSPFAPVEFQGEKITIAQCNNSAIFPGIGLGVIAVKASAVSEEMLYAASEALSQCAPILQGEAGALLPRISEAKRVARIVAIAIAKQAVKEKLTDVTLSEVEAAVDNIIWNANYLPLHLA